MTETKLKSCPFCGGEIYLYISPVYGTYTFFCGCCCAEVFFRDFQHGEFSCYCKGQKAIDAWNRRVNK